MNLHNYKIGTKIGASFAVIVAIVVLIIAKFCGAFGHTL